MSLISGSFFPGLGSGLGLGFPNPNLSPTLTLTLTLALTLTLTQRQVEEKGNVIAGDVWSAHLPYVEAYLQLHPTTKIVALERNRSKVVVSFDRLTNRTLDPEASKNHWQPWQEGARCAPPSSSPPMSLSRRWSFCRASGESRLPSTGVTIFLA